MAAAFRSAGATVASPARSLSVMLVLMAALCVLLAPALHANPVRLPHTTVQLVSESLSIAGGEDVSLAIVMTPIPGWHTYYRNVGETGVETSAGWVMPPGFAVAPLAYPAPMRVNTAGVVIFGYDGPATLLTRVQAPQRIAGDIVPIRLHLSWLVCSDQLCVPEEATLDVRLLVAPAADNPAHAALFRAARHALPRPSPWPARYALVNGRFRLQVDAGRGLPPLSDVQFFPDQPGVMAASAPAVSHTDRGVIALETAQARGASAPAVLPGVLTLRGTADAPLEGFAVEAQRVASLPPVTAAAGRLHPMPLLLALALAVLGGLLLNVMPCVFPILSLKVLALSQSAGDETRARREALAYTAGVLVTFLLLAAGMFALRAAGVAVGWGFHLQEPSVVALLMLLMLAIALNLFGVFEVTLPMARAGDARTRVSGWQGAFWTGALAVVVASPCSAPFMATATGAALLASPPVGLLIFAGLGLGMALPFLLAAYWPALRAKLPKPGRWMVRLRLILGLPMLVTALWLAWVASRQIGLDGQLMLLASAVQLILGLWLYGRWQERQQAPLRLAGVVAVAVSLVLPFTLMPTAARQPQDADVVSLLAAQPYSAAALAQAQARGGPLFVYFTADWCISCTVNERTSLSDARVAQAFAKAGVAVLVADWTRRDAAITRALEQHGRSGVPLYLWYPAGSRTPQILPQILTPGMLLALTETSKR